MTLVRGIPSREEIVETIIEEILEKEGLWKRSEVMS